MILGIGTDIAQVSRFKKWVQDQNDNLPLREIASVDELNSKRVYEFLDSLKEGIKEFIEMSKKVRNISNRKEIGELYVNNTKLTIKDFISYINSKPEK